MYGYNHILSLPWICQVQHWVPPFSCSPAPVIVKQTWHLQVEGSECRFGASSPLQSWERARGKGRAEDIFIRFAHLVHTHVYCHKVSTHTSQVVWSTNSWPSVIAGRAGSPTANLLQLLPPTASPPIATPPIANSLLQLLPPTASPPIATPPIANSLLQLLPPTASPPIATPPVAAPSYSYSLLQLALL